MELFLVNLFNLGKKILIKLSQQKKNKCFDHFFNGQFIKKIYKN